MFVFVHRKKNDRFVNISFRSRGKIKVNSLIDKVLDGLNGQGGGHPYAAACSVLVSDFPKFKKRVFEEFEN